MDTAMQRRGQLFASPCSRTDCVRDQFAVVDSSWLRTVRGQSASTAAACSRTIKDVACARTWIVCGRDCGRGLNADTDSSWTRKVSVRGLSQAESGSRICRVRGHEPHTSRGQSALSPRLLRGRRNLVSTRGRACPVLNMMRNTLPSLLQHLIAPVLQMRGDCLDTGGLFNRSHFDAPGVVSTEWRIR